MGGRVSVPRGPGGTTEASRIPANPSVRQRRLSLRQLAVPAGIVTMACLFYVYSRTSIQAAKINARRHREADGGSISWRNESLRRHGQLEKPEERTLWAQLTAAKDDESPEAREKRVKKGQEARAKRGLEHNPIEEGIRKARQGRDEEE